MTVDELQRYDVSLAKSVLAATPSCVQTDKACLQRLKNISEQYGEEGKVALRLLEAVESLLPFISKE